LAFLQNPGSAPKKPKKCAENGQGGEGLNRTSASAGKNLKKSGNSCPARFGFLLVTVDGGDEGDPRPKDGL
jgi:hypothetical protein